MHQLYPRDSDPGAIARGAVESAIAFDAYCGGEIRIDEAG